MSSTSSGGYATKEAFANVAVSQTDSVLVAAVAGKRIRVVNFIAATAGTTTNVTFNSKGGGAGTAISPLFALGVNGGYSPGFSETGYFSTNVGEGLTVTTGAGSTTGVWVQYIETS